MKTHDLIAQENDSFDHFNTGASCQMPSPACNTETPRVLLHSCRLSGWMWIKQSKEASDAWNEVLKMDLENTSRDQNNFNKVRALTRLHLRVD